jgi:hypothetical protein
MSRAGRRALLACAGSNIVLHVAGLVLAATLMRPGSPLAPLEQRLEYLSTHRFAWALGWAAWMLCALLLVWFLAAVGAHATRHAATASAAVALAAAGGAVDLFCDVIQMLVLPPLAAAGPANRAVFLAFERAAGAGGLVAANGLYSLAVLLMAGSLRDRLPPLALGLGVATFLSGMLMAAAGLGADPLLLPLATGATVAAFLAWLTVVTRGLLRGA